MPDTGNSPQAVEKPWLWRPGQSGNPSGRPAGFARRIRELTRNGEELVEFALKVLRGEISTLDTKGEGVVLPNFKERIEALKWLSERGWGRAPESSVDPLATLSDEELLEMVKAEVLRREKAKGEAQ